MKRGRPKGKGVKVGIKAQIIDVAQAESSKSAVNRVRTEGLASSTPASKRKREEIVQPSRSAAKKLMEARKLAMEAAAECGISLERSNGHKRSVGQLGETARLARSVCDELTKFHTTVTAAVRQARIDFPDNSSLCTTSDSDASENGDILVVGSSVNANNANGETFAHEEELKEIGLHEDTFDADDFGGADMQEVIDRDDRSEPVMDGESMSEGELYGEGSDPEIVSRANTNGFHGQPYRDGSVSSSPIGQASVSPMPARGFPDIAFREAISSEQDIDLGYGDLHNSTIPQQPRAGPSIEQPSRARARSESSTYSSIEDDNESDWSSIGETEPAALSRPHAADRNGAPSRRGGERGPRASAKGSGAEKIERRGRPARNPAALRAAKVRALEQKGLPLTAALLEDRTWTDVKLAKASYKNSDKVNAKQDKADGTKPKKRRDRTSKVGKGKGGPPRSKPHPILAPQRMAQSRLALLNADGLEAERKARRQGPEWVEAQIYSLRQMHLGIAVGEIRAPPGYIAPLDLDLWFTPTPAPPKTGTGVPVQTETRPVLDVQTDITVFSLRLDIPFMNRSINEWRHGLSGHRFANTWSSEAEDDAKTLVDSLDHVVYQKDINAMFELVKNIKVNRCILVQTAVDADQAPEEESTAEQNTEQDTRPDAGEEGGGGTGEDDQPAEVPGGGSGSGNDGGDDGDDSKKGPPETNDPALAPTEEEEEEERKRQAETGQEEQPTAEVSVPGDEGELNPLNIPYAIRVRTPDCSLAWSDPFARYSDRY